MKHLILAVLTLSVSVIMNPLAEAFPCSSYGSGGKGHCPHYNHSTTVSNYPVYNAVGQCSTCATQVDAQNMWCTCPGNPHLIWVHEWNDCDKAGGYLSYVNNIIACVQVNSNGQGSIISSGLGSSGPESFMVEQVSGGSQVKAKSSSYTINKSKSRET